jgi:hypothetical protein
MITKCQEYLEAGLSRSMKNSNVIHSVLSTSCPSIINLVQILHLGNKRNGGGDYSAQKEGYQRNIWKTYSWSLFRLIWLNRSVITVLYAKMTIKNHGCLLFEVISRIESCIKVLSKMDCNIIQIIWIIVTFTKIVTSVMGSVAHTSLNLLLGYQILSDIIQIFGRNEKDS